MIFQIITYLCESMSSGMLPILTKRHEKTYNQTREFLQLLHRNASDAYRRAYSCEKMRDKQVWEESCKLLSNPNVAQRVKELQEEQKNKSDITKERILQELSGIAFSSIASMHNTWIERKEFDELSDKEKSAIKSISTKILKKNIGTSDAPEIVDVEYVKIELYDKIKAIERICKMLGFDEPTEIEMNTSKPISVEEAKKLIERL